MKLRRSDFLAMIVLLLLHGLLFVGELRGLRFKLDHFANTALLLTNIYFVYSAFLIRGVVGRLSLLLYPVGYGALPFLFSLSNPDWRALFFPLGIVYCSVYRLPAGKPPDALFSFNSILTGT